jgi:hypothetical protein
MLGEVGTLVSGSAIADIITSHERNFIIKVKLVRRGFGGGAL